MLGGLCTFIMQKMLILNNTKVLKLGYAHQKANKAHQIGVAIISQELVKQLDIEVTKSDDLYSHLRKSLPMIYKPAKWIDYEIGGYYLKPTNIMRI